MAGLLTDQRLADIVALIPESWLPEDPGFAGKDAQRGAYANFLEVRLQHSGVFVEEALRARASHV
jgi:hypothetical protein